MGKKAKVGKQRKDKFYQLAKETGLRARSAFKLIQLNRKFEFLQRARIVIDLCAAPGGWMQVAQQNMPRENSRVIGIDLVGIKPIAGPPDMTTLQEDITTDKCKQKLMAELQGQLVDCVLNDGAPNVGKNWLHDAFTQAQLVLSALKLATHVLRKNGWFVTKVFRSKDHPALLVVFNQLFNKVHVTKPQASRNESAEIFVVCEGYKRPAFLEPALVDPKSVFKDLDLEPAKKLNLLHPEKKKGKAEGYVDGDLTVYHNLPASKFISSDNYTDLLGQANTIVLDGTFGSHPSTTKELRECLKDIQVLGRRELKLIMDWRKRIRKELEEASKEDGDEDGENNVETTQIAEPTVEEEMEMQLAESELEDKKKEKRLKKKEARKKSETRKKIDLEMVIPGDAPDLPESDELFSLKRISKTKDYGAPSTSHEENFEEDEDEEMDMETEEMPSDDILMDENTGLDKDARAQRKANLWFRRATEMMGDGERGDGLLSDDDEDDDIDNVENIVSAVRKARSKKRGDGGDGDERAKEDEEEDGDEEKETEETCGKKVKKEKIKREDEEAGPSSNDAGDGAGGIFDESGQKVNIDDLDDSDSEDESDGENIDQNRKSRIKLDAEGLALGAMMVTSSKTKRDLIEEGYNRYAFNDDNLPGWFVSDEKKHFKKMLPIPKELIEEYKKRDMGVGARGIKKVVEAKARKKKRAVQKMERVKKKANAVADNPELGDREKANALKKIYKQANDSDKKQKVTYVVAKKNQVSGRRYSRPGGLKGHYKVVDPRMKSDMRGGNSGNRGEKGGRGGGRGGRGGGRSKSSSRGGGGGGGGRRGGGRGGGRGGKR